MASLGIALLLSPAAKTPLLVWNATPSLARGLYAVENLKRLEAGVTVAARLPTTWAVFADRRGYLPRGVPLLKTIAAGPGDRVCASADRLEINGSAPVRRLLRDGSGRPLPRWNGCVRLRVDEVLLLARAHPRSFDGRYFGPVRASLLIGQARLLWRA